MPGTCGTAGGLTINENAQVVNVNGEPIEHLYAVGNCSSGVSGGTYVHGGISLGSGAVMSWVAVNHVGRPRLKPTSAGSGSLPTLPAHTLPFGGFASAKPPPLSTEGRRFNGEHSFC